MNKKLVAVAVAGLFAAPIYALAQSSVTISGVLKQSFENASISNFGGGVGGRAAGAHNSQYGLADDSSRIIFNVVEDLGGGMQAIGQMDIRIKPDDGGATPGALTAAQNTGNMVNGNSHVGLRSKTWGRIFFGRQDLHYFNTESNMTAKANSLRADPISLSAYAGAYAKAGAAVNGGTAVAGGTRTQNVVHYTTPNWGGFTAIVAYSSNPSGTDADINSVVRRGYAWNVNPNYAAANWQIGYSYWKAKPDGGSAAPGAFATADQRGDRVYGSYTFGFGLKIGGTWDRSKLTDNSVAGAGTTLSKRDVWSLPIGYYFGNHNINFHYTWAQKDKAPGANGLDTKADMWAIGYAYDLSKRTSVGVTYASINNHTNAGYNFFTGGSLGNNGSVLAGEDPKMFAATLRHAF